MTHTADPRSGLGINQADYEAEPLYPASALAAAEARGVQIGLERAAKVADEVSTSSLDRMGSAEAKKKGRQTYWLQKSGAAQEIATAIRSLSPAHKGSDNV